LKNNSKKAGVGSLFLLSLKTVIKKGLAFSIMDEQGDFGLKGSKIDPKFARPFFITLKGKI
jgi:hypothetical protein